MAQTNRSTKCSFSCGRARASTKTLHGFTLIELLVVVAIIALLVAILVPSLEEARRVAAVVVCSSNLHQIGVGFGIYLTQWGEYPPPCTGMPTIIYTPEFGLSSPPIGFDNRRNLMEMVSGATKDIFFCPLWNQFRPEDSTTINEYSDYFYVYNTAGGVRHCIGYTPLALFSTKISRIPTDFTYSGNPDGGPPLPGDPNSAIFSDLQWDSPLFDPLFPDDRPFDWRWPRASGHNSVAGGPIDDIYYDEFREGNCLYGDGHVVTRTECKNYVLRNGIYYLAY